MLTLYDITVPVFAKGLNNLLAIIDRTEQFAKERGFDVDRFVDMRLYPDMYSFGWQVEYACFVAVEIVGKLAGKKELELMYDTRSIAELRQNINKSLGYLRDISREDLSGAEDRLVPLFHDPERVARGRDYVTEFALPNFHFHYVTAYDILRHNGVALRKEDYVGGLTTKAKEK